MHGLVALVVGIGIAQVISWGSLYYSISVLGPAIRADTGTSETFLFGAYTAGLVLSGLLAPRVGRLIDRRGGRSVMSAGSVAGAVALAILAAASNAAMVALGWAVAGVAMAATLYDPAFAALSQHAGDRYRRAVTAVTLFGGFASTVFWPFAQLLLEAWGWRVALGTFAALHLLVCLPIHRAVIPPTREREARTKEAGERSTAFGDPRLAWLNAAFGIASFIVGIIAVHMVGLLTGIGLTTAQAVAAGMLMGPMQVVGRVVEITFLGKMRATAIGTLSFSLVTLAALMIAFSDSRPALAIAFVACYGFGNGIFTIVRGAAPAEMYGSAGLGELLGHLARASLFARAIAPGSYPLLLALGLTQKWAMLLLAGLALLALACYAKATGRRSRSS
jgi:predicted MFS family arabinose efflux permease